MAHKEILKGHQARLKVKAGVDIACDAVRPTLGAVGMTALIEFPGLDPIECDDGVTILKNIELKDKYENMGVLSLRKAALRTSKEGGDGTATTAVFTQALLHEAFKRIANDSSKIREVKEDLSKGLKEVLDILNRMKREVSIEDIEKIATVSSLDPEVAKIISDIIKEVGIHGVVTVEQGAQLGYSKEIVKGAKFDKGLISSFFINNAEDQSCVLEDPYIVLIDRKVSMNEQVLPILQSIGTGTSILFIADDIDSVALGTLAHNAANGIARIACVRNPYSASRAKEFLFDMAALTGATVISEEMGMKLEEANKSLCGRAEKVVVTKDTTTIIGGKGGGNLESRVVMLEGEIENAISEYQRSILADRLAALTGGIGVIRVGAYTDGEFNAKKYKFDNAVKAAQAALQEGILPGGGIALLDASVKFPAGSMFREALAKPFMQMAENAGMGSLEGFRWSVHEYGTGYDFRTKEQADMFEAGIIDAYKVTRLALESAVAIVTSLVGMETAITILEDEKK